MTRQIKYIVIHTTATSQQTKVESIQRYWRITLGWRSPGYHIIIEPNGNIVRLAPDSAITNGVAGYNANSLHVSYIGGVDANGKAIDNRTPAQKKAMEQVVKEWKIKYPDAKVQGHRDFLKPGPKWKDCPCFDAKKWWDSIRCLAK